MMIGTLSCNEFDFCVEQSPSGWDVVLEWVGHCIVMGLMFCKAIFQWVGHCSVMGESLSCNGLYFCL